MQTLNTEVDQERAARLIESIEQDLRSLKQLLRTQPAPGLSVAPSGESGGAYYLARAHEDQGIEGVFDGERMVDESGKTYQVSANYASKSKLVEGDPLKLYITPDGKFFYKQLGPVERQTLPAVLRAEGSHYVVDAEDGNTYNVLTASVTYFMSLYGVRPGDRLMVTIPADRPASWAVIDNLL